MKYVSIFSYGKKGYIAVNLDMSKAYNRVECAFIEKVMEKIGFHERWISLIMHCITIVSYSVLINGVAYGSIITTRGLRQGDLFSSYLFLLCTNGFSSLINNVVQYQMMSGITISRGCPMITHLSLQTTTYCFVKQVSTSANNSLISSNSTKLHLVIRLILINH